jgi:2'-5' RNA ligase
MDTTFPQVFESTLSILVPEAEDLVGSFRVRFNPSAARGMPAHVTINYPFLPGSSADGAPEAELRNLFRRFRPFLFKLSRVARWPGVIYIAAEPVEPFLAMIRGVMQAFPDSPPYGGIFHEFVPHLTVAHHEDPAMLETIAKEFEPRAAARLPISCHADKGWLLDNRNGRWEKRLRLPFSGNDA